MKYTADEIRAGREASDRDAVVRDLLSRPALSAEPSYRSTYTDADAIRDGLVVGAGLLAAFVLACLGGSLWP